MKRQKYGEAAFVKTFQCVVIHYLRTGEGFADVCLASLWQGKALQAELNILGRKGAAIGQVDSLADIKGVGHGVGGEVPFFDYPDLFARLVFLGHVLVHGAGEVLGGHRAAHYGIKGLILESGQRDS